jgi:hypothetical protein
MVAMMMAIAAARGGTAMALMDKAGGRRRRRWRCVRVGGLILGNGILLPLGVRGAVCA